MYPFLGILIAMQIYQLAIALFYDRPHDALFPDKGYHMWKQLACFTLIPLGLAIFTLVSLRSLGWSLILSLSIESVSFGLLIHTLFYFRPRQIQVFGIKDLWKFITVLCVFLALDGLATPFIFTH